MRVVIDIQAAIAQRAGVGRYTKSLVENLPRWSDGDEIRLFYFDFQRKGVPFPVEGAAQKAVHWCPGRLVQKAWKTLGWPPFDAFAGRADVYHFPNFVRPPLRRGRSVVTIHDASFLRFPETLEPRNLQYLRAKMMETVVRADAVIANSAFTARELEILLNVPRGKLFPILLGLSPGMEPPGDAAVLEMRKELKLERPYILTLGTLEPRKNMVFLMEVFEKLEGFDGDLVIAGRRGWKYEPILDKMRRSPRAARIRYLEFVDDWLLPSLYAGAELFVFPSLYEGFGFPPLEAMACGTPVISSRAASLPEVLGEAAAYVEDFDVETWRCGLTTLLGDSSERQVLRAAGLEHVRKYSWAETARRTWTVYRLLV